MVGDDARVVEREDIGVMQLCGRGDLPKECPGTNTARRFTRDRLECDDTSTCDVPREIDISHRPLTELPIDQVALCDSGTKVRVFIGDGALLDLEQLLQRHC